jgi:thioredoxin 1
MSDEVLHVNDANFDAEVLQSDLPVLVDFWAEWCGPCRMLSPILTEVAKELSGKVKIVKMNVDESSETPTEYKVQSIPTLLMFKGGKVVANKIGAIPKVQLVQFINANL